MMIGRMIFCQDIYIYIYIYIIVNTSSIGIQLHALKNKNALFIACLIMLLHVSLAEICDTKLNIAS